MAGNILEMKDITKEFFGVKALDRITFSVEQGEIHAICGENGAGKSTLMKILSGVYPYGSYEGEIYINGELSKFSHIKQSEQAGVSIIHQELLLNKELSIAENIFQGNLIAKRGLVDWNRMYHETSLVLKELGMQIPANTELKYLGIGQQQLVAIAKALIKKTDILVLDEPTAALTETEVEILLQLLLKLKERGITCIYISHKFNEVFRVADKITVLRDGRSVGTCDKIAIDEHGLISLMVGRELSEIFPKVDHSPGKVVLEVSGLSVMDRSNAKKAVIREASFSVREGEIVGIAGLMGSGRTELVTSVFGAYEGRKQGRIKINGTEVKIRGPVDAIRNGMALVSEDRKRQGLIIEQNIIENTTLASLRLVSQGSVIDRGKEKKYTDEYIKSLKIKTPSAEVLVKTLSGGNQQKVVLGKWLMTKPKILFLDEPTRGIDVGAKFEIYNIMNELVQQGVSIVMVSSELPEVLGMSDRILVMHQGKVAAELDSGEATQEKIMYYATGGR